VFGDDLPTLERHRQHHSQSGPRLRIGMLKGFLDGSLGSRTAALLAPYSDQPDNRGVLAYTQDQLNEMVRQRVAARFQIGLHAIGDQAARMALDAFTEAQSFARHLGLPSRAGFARDGVEPGPPSRAGFRFRLEHVQAIAPADIPRLGQLGVIASVQPCHLLTDMQWIAPRLGPERSRHAYPWRELLESGARLAFGSDYPIESCNPFRGLYAAVTRRNQAGTQEFHPGQKIAMAQAIAAFTTGSAYAEFAERDKGTLLPGMLADFVVLDRDLLRIAPQEILHTRVLRTVVGGETVYEAKG
jgi:predicted amidohydrolase YtcJ